jgi:hypothetical protein
MPVDLETQAFHSSIVFRRPKIMNTKAQRLSVQRSDSFIMNSMSVEAELAKATNAGMAISVSDPDIQAAFCRLLWALGSSAPIQQVEEMAETWRKMVERAHDSTSSDGLHDIVADILIGMQAYVPARRH